MLQVEQILQKRYQLQQQLGQNAGRQTWLAVDLDESPAQSVIVKQLAFNPQMHWDELKLFEREAQVLKHLNHPCIPQYRDYFAVDRETGDGLPWFGLVQQYIPGNSLQQLLDQGERFTEPQTQQIATSVLEILIYLHELSPPVFHRDIKPSNLILGKDGQVYLVDFGAVQDRATAEGATFTVVGTSGYSPPEQLWGRAVAASDFYALGTTVIHLLTGTAPADLPQRQMRIQFADRVSLNPNFAQWLAKLTEPAPERRFSTARQALLALQASRDCTSPVEQASQFASSSVRYGRLANLALLQLVLVGAASAVVLPNFNFCGDREHPNCANVSHKQESRGENRFKFSWVPLHQKIFAKTGCTRGDLVQPTGAEQKLSKINRAQQAYFLDKFAFSSSIEDLDLGIKTQTKNYDYLTRTNAHAAFNYGISRSDRLKSYVAGVFVVSTDNGMTTRAILCEANVPGTNQPAHPTLDNGVPVCGSGTTQLSR